MRNQGVEVMLSGDLISRKDMALTLSGNFSYNKNKLISLSNDRYTMEYLTPGLTENPCKLTRTGSKMAGQSATSTDGVSMD